MILGNLNHSGNLFTSFFVRCCARDFYICRPLTLKLRIVKFVKSLFLPPPPPGPLMLKTHHIHISIIMNWYVFIISNPKYLTRCWNVLETNLVFKTLVSHWRVPSRLFFVISRRNYYVTDKQEKQQLQSSIGKLMVSTLTVGYRLMERLTNPADRNKILNSQR